MLAYFQIFSNQRTHIFAKTMESELAFRFASRCNAAGKVNPPLAILINVVPVECFRAVGVAEATPGARGERKKWSTGGNRRSKENEERGDEQSEVLASS